MLSILIPVYNYPIAALLKSLHEQCVAGGIAFEILVQDDASTLFYIDNTEAATALPHCKFEANKANLGRTHTRKILAEKAAFETLLFLDADVMPASSQFIKNYVEFIGTKNVVLGGYAYTNNNDPDKSLRYTYGKSREEKPASERNKNTYASVFSGNILIDKQVFIDNNYADNLNFYGLDIYFSYKLYYNAVPVIHIDNTIYHLGLESNKVYFDKQLQSVKVRKELLADEPGIENVNSLLKHYKKLKKLHLTGIVSIMFLLSRGILKKMILRKNPSLFCLDIYRLGYICQLK